MVLDASLLNTQHYKVRIKGKVEQSREGVAPSPTHWCSSYWKGSLWVTLDYGRQLYFIYIYIYIYKQTVLSYYNSLVWLDMQYASSWDQNLANFSSIRYLTPELLSFTA